MNDLIKSLSIEALLIKRADLIDRFQRIQLLAEEMQQLGSLGDGHWRSMPEIRWYHNGHNDDIIESKHRKEPHANLLAYIKCIDKAYWAYLMEQSGMLGLMDSTAKQEWDRSLENGSYPELTLENIHATFQDLQLSREEIFKRGLIKTFESLSPRYKTNDQFKLGKRIVLSNIGGYNSWGGQKLDDLIRCMHILDGKPEPPYDLRTHNQVVRAERERKSQYQTEYVEVKFYGNGNGHIKFLRPDLIEKMNKIVWTTFPFHLPHDNRTPKEASV